jgi:hypothetical protein
MFRHHVSLKPFRQSLKTTSIMPPTIPEKPTPRNSRTQWVLGSGTGITNATTVQLDISNSTPLLTTQSGSDAGSCPGLISDDSDSSSDISSVSRFNTANPKWKTNVKEYINRLLVSHVSRPGFDLDKFNITVNKLVYSSSDALDGVET